VWFSVRAALFVRHGLTMNMNKAPALTGCAIRAGSQTRDQIGIAIDRV
jgi:hypothetical protein